MGAITGLIRFDGKPVSSEAEQMMLRMPHRIPRGLSAWHDDRISLCQAVSPSVPQASPTLITREGVSLAIHGRIDGLAENICQSDHMIDLYLKEGPDFVKNILGDFAFALWDTKSKRLILGRDPVGIKPLYYYSNNNFLAFASEIKAFWSLPDVEMEVNEARLAEYLSYRNENRTQTFFKNIKRIMPARTMIIQDNAILPEKRYWDPMHIKELVLSSDAEYVGRFLELFTQSVKDRLRTDSIIGSHLSGGLDSTSIAAMAKYLLGRTPAAPKALHTFSLTYPESPGSDESYFIQKGIDWIQPEKPHVLNGSEECFFWTPDDFLVYEDEPYLPHVHGATHSIHTRAQKEGVGVLLDGFGGDEVLSHSSQALAEALRLRRWRDLKLQLKIFKVYFTSPGKALFYIWKSGVRPTSLFILKGIKHHLERFFPILYRINSLASPELLRKLDLPRKASSPRPGGIKDHAYIHSTHSFYLPIEVLERSAAYHGIDLRFPFFDRRLLEFCVSLPLSQTLGINGFGRYELRRAMQGFLPPEIQWRRGKANLDNRHKHSIREASFSVILNRDFSSANKYLSRPINAKTIKRTDKGLRLLWKISLLASWLTRIKRL